MPIWMKRCNFCFVHFSLNAWTLLSVCLFFSLLNKLRLLLNLVLNVRMFGNYQQEFKIEAFCVCVSPLFSCYCTPCYKCADILVMMYLVCLSHRVTQIVLFSFYHRFRQRLILLLSLTWHIQCWSFSSQWTQSLPWGTNISSYRCFFGKIILLLD